MLLNAAKEPFRPGFVASVTFGRLLLGDPHSKADKHGDQQANDQRQEALDQSPFCNVPNTFPYFQGMEKVWYHNTHSKKGTWHKYHCRGPMIHGVWFAVWDKTNAFLTHRDVILLPLLRSDVDWNRGFLGQQLQINSRGYSIVLMTPHCPYDFDTSWWVTLSTRRWTASVDQEINERRNPNTTGNQEECPVFWWYIGPGPFKRGAIRSINLDPVRSFRKLGRELKITKCLAPVTTIFQHYKSLASMLNHWKWMPLIAWDAGYLQIYPAASWQ